MAWEDMEVTWNEVGFVIARMGHRENVGNGNGPRGGAGGNETRQQIGSKVGR